MTIIYMDGFDTYGSADMSERDWTGNIGYSFPVASQGRRSTNGLMIDQALQNGLRGIRKTFPSNQTITMGWAMRIPSFVSQITVTACPLLMDSALGAQISVTVDTSGYVSVRRGGYTGTILGTSSNPIGANEWNHYQLKVYVDNSSGTAELKINDTTVVNYGPGDTQSSGNANIAYMQWYINTSNGYNFYVDDLYILDGTSPNNTFLGDCRIDSIHPTGAGTSTDWTPSAGSNYECVDETEPNDDTDYINESTVGDHDSYAFGDLSSSGSVYGVQTQLFARKEDAGSRSIKGIIRSGSTDYTPGDTHALGDSYHAYLDQHDVDPDTSSAWTISGVNAAEFGVKLEA